jgi:hypothetical protein
MFRTILYLMLVAVALHLLWSQILRPAVAELAEIPGGLLLAARLIGSIFLIFALLVLATGALLTLISS